MLTTFTPSGYQGLQGITGYAGDQGFKGEKGFVGAPGLTGLGKISFIYQLNFRCNKNFFLLKMVLEERLENLAIPHPHRHLQKAEDSFSHATRKRLQSQDALSTQTFFGKVTPSCQQSEAAVQWDKTWVNQVHA